MLAVRRRSSLPIFRQDALTTRALAMRPQAHLLTGIDAMWNVQFGFLKTSACAHNTGGMPEERRWGIHLIYWPKVTTASAQTGDPAQDNDERSDAAWQKQIERAPYLLVQDAGDTKTHREAICADA